MGREQADKCIDSLNDKITLPGAAHGVQVRYAEGELDRLEPKLFVGMVPKNASEVDLRDLFSKYGLVVEVVLLRSPDGRSRGAAFVRFDSLEAAEAAIHALHDKHSMPGGVHPLVVRRADTSYEKRKKRRMQYRHGYRPAPMYPPPMSAFPPMFLPQLPPQFSPDGFDPAIAFSASVYISSIPERWTDDELFGLFAKFGNVVQSSVVVDVNTRLSRCFGFVTFDNARSAEESIRSLHGLHIEGRVLKVEPKKGRLY
jgi:RNA recognition motif-containing protein